MGRATANARWSFLGLGVKVVVQAVAAFLVARIVGEHAYATMSLGLVYVTITYLLIDQGMSQALIRADDLKRSDVATVQVTTIAISIVLMLLTFLIAVPAGHLYDTAPQLTPVLVVLGLGLILKALWVPGQAVLQRNFQFQWLAGCEIVSSVSGVAASLAVALLGGKAQAVSAQQLVTDGVFAAGVIWRAGLPLRGGNVRALRGMLGFTSQIAGSQWLGFVSRNADNLLIGKVLGAVPLSLYAVSYRLMMIPITNLAMVANRVLLPTYSRMQDDLAGFKVAFLKSCRLMALAAAPLMALLIAFAQPLIVGVMGPSWRGAVVPTQILSIVAVIQAQSSLITPAIIAFGRARWQLWWSTISCVLVVGLFVVTVPSGLNAVCWGYLAYNVIAVWVPIGLVGRFGGFGYREFVRAVVPGFVAGLLFFGVGAGVRYGLAQAGLPLLVILVVGGGAALLVATAALRLVLPGAFAEGLSLVRRQRARSVTEPPVPATATAG